MRRSMDDRGPRASQRSHLLMRYSDHMHGESTSLPIPCVFLVHIKEVLHRRCDLRRERRRLCPCEQKGSSGSCVINMHPKPLSFDPSSVIWKSSFHSGCGERPMLGREVDRVSISRRRAFTFRPNFDEDYCSLDCSCIFRLTGGLSFAFRPRHFSITSYFMQPVPTDGTPRYPVHCEWSSCTAKFSPL